MQRFTISLSAVVIAALLSSQVRANNLVANGSFETGDLTGWTVDPFSQGNTTASVYSGSYCCGGATPPDGTFAVAFGGGGAFAGEIAQAFATVPGVVYAGSLEYMGVGTPDSNVIVTLGDAISLTPLSGPTTLDPLFGGDQWQTYHFSFTATSTLSGIDILGTNDQGCCSDTMVDHVVITATPEPTSLLLGSLGVAGLAVVVRRRKR